MRGSRIALLLGFAAALGLAAWLHSWWARQQVDRGRQELIQRFEDTVSRAWAVPPPPARSFTVGDVRLGHVPAGEAPVVRGPKVHSANHGLPIVSTSDERRR
jgi:hypothetical protein